MAERSYPDRPYLAASAAIVRDGHVLVVRRARQPTDGAFSLPGGVVESGETLAGAAVREVREETGIAIEPVGLAGYREFIRRDEDGRVALHFVILAFAARWLSGEFRPSAEIAEARWVRPAEIKELHTTEGLAQIVADAFALLEQHG